MSLQGTFLIHGVQVSPKITIVRVHVHVCVNFRVYTERPEETDEDKLRSILAQLEFSHNVHEYDSNGVPFRYHLYVPEIHPISGTEHHEREDDAHVLKVTSNIFRYTHT